MAEEILKLPSSLSPFFGLQGGGESQEFEACEHRLQYFFILRVVAAPAHINQISFERGFGACQTLVTSLAQKIKVQSLAQKIKASFSRTLTFLLQTLRQTPVRSKLRLKRLPTSRAVKGAGGSNGGVSGLVLFFVGFCPFFCCSFVPFVLFGTFLIFLGFSLFFAGIFPIGPLPLSRSFCL